MRADQLKAKFNREGLTVTEWARTNNFPREAVYQVINGLCKGKYGRGHEIAVKLGLKPADAPKPGDTSKSPA